MIVVEIPSNITYTNLYTLSGYDSGSSLILTNNTSYPAFVVQAQTPALAESDQYPVYPGQTVIVSANDGIIWVRGGTGPFLVQKLLELITPFVAVDLPAGVWTSNDERFRRLAVDSGQTGFEEGREFRAVRKIIITSGTPLVWKFSCTTDFILSEQTLNTSVGDIELFAYRTPQGTPGGTFGTSIPVIMKNISSEYREYDGGRYVSQATISSGGTFTPNVATDYIDYDRAKTSNATAQQLSVSGGSGTQRYLAAGDYYLIFTSLVGTSEGRFAISWEERI